MHNEDFDQDPEYIWVSCWVASPLWEDEKTEAARRRDRNQRSTIDDLKKACGVS